MREEEEGKGIRRSGCITSRDFQQSSLQDKQEREIYGKRVRYRRKTLENKEKARRKRRRLSQVQQGSI